MLQTRKTIIDWAKGQGFKTIEPKKDLHVTIAFSREPLDWMTVGDGYASGGGDILISPGGPRIVEPLGDAGAAVLFFASSELSWRHQAIRDAGASWDNDQYQPHITITYEPGDIDLSKVEPYRGKIALGPEIFEEIDEDVVSNLAEKREFTTTCIIEKIDEDMRVVWGWASVYEEKGEPVVDTHGDILDEKDVVKGAHKFMEDQRTGKVMHAGPRIGTVVESVVFTRQLQNALDIDLGKAGWHIGMKIDDPDVWKQVKDGTLRAFSFGGTGRRVARERA